MTGRLPTLAAIALLAAAPGARAQGIALDPLADRFAACTGRLSALMEHQWMQDDPASAGSETRLETLRDLLAAVLPEGAEGAGLARESEAKLAFERLLERAEAEEDPRDAAWARARADNEIAACAAIILE